MAQRSGKNPVEPLLSLSGAHTFSSRDTDLVLSVGQAVWRVPIPTMTPCPETYS